MPNLMERAITEVNDLDPDIVICSGDLTTFGFKQEYAQAKEYLDQIHCEAFVVIPGNHDSRNVGYVHFEEMFGSRNSVCRVGGVTVVAVDSTEPDLDHGQIGRGRYPWIEEQFAAEPADLRIFVLHHHLLPVPGTGRERNIVHDAGDALECLQRAGVKLVLSGHKHVPYAWKLEDLFIVNAGTVSSLRLRGNTRPCYNLIEVSDAHVDVWRKYPFHGQERIIQFSTETLAFEKYTARIDGRGHHALMTRAVAVIDGEHYAPVVRDALERAAARGRRRVARRRHGEAARAARTTACRSSPTSRRRCATCGPTSSSTSPTSPCWGRRERFRLASRVLALGIRVRGAGLPARPAASSRRSRRRRWAIVGTGKRVGKTAVTGYAARLLARGRSTSWSWRWAAAGRPEPEVVELRPTVEDLLELSRAGRHAASDYLETAALAGVVTVGCRRCGGGLAGRGRRLERARGRRARRGAQPRPRRSSTAAAPRCRRCARARACSSRARIRAPTSSRGTSTRTGSSSPTSSC